MSTLHFQGDGYGYDVCGVGEALLSDALTLTRHRDITLSGFRRTAHVLVFYWAPPEDAAADPRYVALTKANDVTTRIPVATLLRIALAWLDVEACYDEEPDTDGSVERGFRLLGGAAIRHFLAHEKMVYDWRIAFALYPQWEIYSK